MSFSRSQISNASVALTVFLLSGTAATPQTSSPLQSMPSVSGQGVENVERNAFLAGFVTGDAYAIIAVRRTVGSYKIALLASILEDLGAC
jgi:hypothetical protein